MEQTFGTQLRLARKKQHLSAEALARDCGISRSYIILIEGGKRLPSKKVLPNLADVLNLSLTEVLNWYLEDVSTKMRKSLNLKPSSSR